MTPAIVLAAHGSTRAEPLAALERFRARVSERYPGLPVRVAYTSRHVRHRLAEDQASAPPVNAVLAELRDQGVKRVVLQSLHVIPGREYHELEDLARESLERGDFQAVELGAPLLSGQGVQRAAQALLDISPKRQDDTEAVLFMGHGTWHSGNQAYTLLNQALAERDPRVLIGTMKGELDFESVPARLAELGVATVHLLPLFFGAGAHAEEDMAGDGDHTWESRLAAADIACKAHVQSGVDNDLLADVWLEHLDQALDRIQAGR